MTSSAFRRNPDTYALSVRGRREVRGMAGLSGFADLLSQLGAPPQLIMVGDKRSPFTSSNVDKLFASAKKPRLQFQFGRDEAPRVWFSLNVFPGAPEGRGMALRSYLPAELLERVAPRFAAGIGEALADCEIVVGQCHSMTDLVAAYGDKETSTWEPSIVDEVFWLNWYGAAFVDQLGRERVLATPEATIQQLRDGSVLWTSRVGPADYASEAAREAQAKARVHLSNDLDYATELERLRERSRRIAPVEPAWEPELDALFALVADVSAPSQNEVVARLNALRVPPVSEVRPADEITSDVADPDAAVEEYGMFAEQLIALLHDKVDHIASFDPAELPQLDAYVWNHRYAERFPANELSESLVPAVGGYLGELLVRLFGGRWVPRKNVAEAAVVVGDRAWLPFARARAYLASHDGALTASTTQFLRDVERHRA